MLFTYSHEVEIKSDKLDFVFHFCVHETTISRILKSWLHLLDVRFFKLIHWTEK